MDVGGTSDFTTNPVARSVQHREEEPLVEAAPLLLHQEILAD